MGGSAGNGGRYLLCFRLFHLFIGSRKLKIVENTIIAVNILSGIIIILPVPVLA